MTAAPYSSQGAGGDGARELARVLFAFDRVAHYHVPMLQRLDGELGRHGVELHLAAGDAREQTHGRVKKQGRVGVAQRVLDHEHRYGFSETVLAGWTLRRAPQLPAIVQAVAPQVVVCMAHVGHLAHWHLLRQRDRLGYRLVAWQCGYEYHDHPLKAALLRRFVPRFDHQLAYHSRAADYATRHGMPGSRITVTHNTLDESRIRTPPRAQAVAAVHARHPQLAGRRIVLFVGALLKEKRVEDLAHAVSLLARPEVALVVVGDGPHGPALRAHLGSRTDVVFTGAAVQGVEAYFGAADVYVMPGTGGLGLNEALAHGLPVVSADADGSADDLVIDGHTGLRWTGKDVQSLADGIARLLDAPRLAQRLAQAGRERVRGPLRFERFIERIQGVLLEQVRQVQSSGPRGSEMSRSVPA